MRPPFGAISREFKQSVQSAESSNNRCRQPRVQAIGTVSREQAIGAVSREFKQSVRSDSTHIIPDYSRYTHYIKPVLVLTTQA